MNIDVGDRVRGLYQKYIVKRVDGSSKKGGRHAECEYFVMDINHDPLARYALAAYVEACQLAYPELAKDLRRKIQLNMFDTSERWIQLDREDLIPRELRGSMLKYIRPSGPNEDPVQGG